MENSYPVKIAKLSQAPAKAGLSLALLPSSAKLKLSLIHHFIHPPVPEDFKLKQTC